MTVLNRFLVQASSCWGYLGRTHRVRTGLVPVPSLPSSLGGVVWAHRMSPRASKAKLHLGMLFLRSFPTVRSTHDLVQLNQQIISCQKHHLLGKGIISLEASDPGSSVHSLIVSGIIRMSFVSLAGFMFSMACFYLPANRIFNSIYVPKGVKLKKIQKALPHVSLLERFNHVLLLMQTTENQCSGN